MDYAVIISAIVLGLSILATAAKFLDWFLHSDPKTMVRLIERGVGGLVTNAPEEALRIRRERASLGDAERRILWQV